MWRFGSCKTQKLKLLRDFRWKNMEELHRVMKIVDFESALLHF